MKIPIFISEAAILHKWVFQSGMVNILSALKNWKEEKWIVMKAEMGRIFKNLLSTNLLLFLASWVIIFFMQKM